MKGVEGDLKGGILRTLIPTADGMKAVNPGPNLDEPTAEELASLKKEAGPSYLSAGSDLPV